MQLNDTHKVLSIFYYGRSGSYFLQSLLDSHPNIISTPAGCLRDYYEFWDQNKFLPNHLIISNFINHYDKMLDPEIETTNTHWWGCAINNLGPEQNLPLKVDKDIFVSSLIDLLTPVHKITRRDLFVASHVAYHKSLGREIPDDFIIVFQAHTPSAPTVINLLNDFSNAKFIHMIRNPIQSLGSHIKHHAVDAKPYNGFSGDTLLSVVNGILNGAEEFFSGYNSIACAIRLEDLKEHPRETLTKICTWIGIPWNDSLLESTSGGMQYWFDSSYSGKVTGFSKHTASSTHDEVLSYFDKFRLQVLLKPKLTVWDYDGTEFEDYLLFEQLIKYQFKFEELLSAEEIESGYDIRLRETLYRKVRSISNETYPKPLRLINTLDNNKSCIWDDVFSNDEMIKLNCMFNPHCYFFYIERCAEELLNFRRDIYDRYMFDILSITNNPELAQKVLYLIHSEIMKNRICR